MPVWGKKKNKLSKSDSLEEENGKPPSSVSPSSTKSKAKEKEKEKKSSLKRLFPKRHSKKKQKNSGKNSRIGEIPKPIIQAPSDDNADAIGSTNTTPVKENKKHLSLDKDIRNLMTPNSNDTHGKSANISSPNGDITVSPAAIVRPGHSFSSAETVDSEFFDLPESPINKNSQDEHEFQAHFDNVYNSNSNDEPHLEHMKRLKSLSKFHLEDNHNYGIPNPKSLGDDLTVSTATYNNPISPNLPPGIYVPNYPEIPPSSTTAIKNRDFNAKDLYEDQRKKDNLVSLTKSALRRASNRSSLPAHLAKKWNVEISPPTKDKHTNHYQFNISIRDMNSQSKPLPTSKQKNHTSPPTAITQRSLQDFCWLENALRNEYHGGLLVPLLSMSLGSHGWFDPHRIEKWHTMPKLDGLERMIKDYIEDQHMLNKSKKKKKDAHQLKKQPMEKILSEWLSDILNGVRGHGEWIMNVSNQKIIASESMETFLYRHTDPLPNNTSLSINQSQLDYVESSKSPNQNQSEGDAKDIGFIQEMVQKSLQCFAPNSNNQYGKDEDRPKINAQTMKVPLVDMLNCQSPNTQSGMKQNQNYNFHPRSSPSPSSKHRSKMKLSNIENELISCQSNLLLHYRKVCLSCLTKIHSLIAEEDQRNDAWKRLAISLTNLYSFETDVKMTEFGEGLSKESNTAYSQKALSKSAMESGLRHLTRQKKDRTIPGLKVLNCLIEAYVADLSMVTPSLISHLDAVDADGYPKNDDGDDNSSNGNQHSSDVNVWDLNLKQLGDKLINAKQQINFKHFHQTNSTKKNFTRYSNPDLSSAFQKAQKVKILQNQELFQKSLAMLIKSIPIRIARMAWTFFKLEIVQASLLKEKAMKLKVGLSEQKTSYSKTQNESRKEEEKEDDELEFNILEKITHVGKSSSLSSPQNIDQSFEKARSVHAEKVLRMARERIGRWNANIAMAVMETAGVEDADVRVEEFTRELRSVRKYAIGLRGKVERCVEAVEALMVVTIGDVEDLDENIEVMNGGEYESPKGLRRTVSIESSYEPSSIPARIPLYKRSRNEFLSHMAVVFSGTQVDLSPQRSDKELPNPEILANLGIDTNDPTGWLGALSGENRRNLGTIPIRQQRGNCGKVTASYFKVREANVADLLSRISKKLREYVKRVEGIESFVYMHCVGIQLEKHFEKRRKKLVEAWGMKTDVNTAINLATKKNLPGLVDELNAKLAALSYVSHTAVKQAKDKHLTSKLIKSDLQDLANRRFARAKTCSTERISSIVEMWLEHEEIVALEEMKSLSSSIREIERTVTEEEIKADGGAHLFAFVE